MNTLSLPDDLRLRDDAALDDIRGAVRAVKEALVEPVDVKTALEELAKI